MKKEIVEEMKKLGLDEKNIDNWDWDGILRLVKKEKKEWLKGRKL